LNQCVDVAECAALAGDDDTINLSTFGFEEGSDSAGWRGTSAFLSGDGAGGPCSGAVSVHLLTSPSDGIIRLETQTKEVEGIGRDSDDFCDTDEAIAMEADLPCTSLEAFEGSFVQDI
jgi:hypothetical protein